MPAHMPPPPHCAQAVLGTAHTQAIVHIPSTHPPNPNPRTPRRPQAVLDWNAKSCLRSPGGDCRKTPVYFEFLSIEAGDRRWYPDQVSGVQGLGFGAVRGGILGHAAPAARSAAGVYR